MIRMAPSLFLRAGDKVRPLTLVPLLVLLAACAGPQMKDEIVRFEPSYAKPPAENGPLARMAGTITADHGAACTCAGSSTTC